MSWGVKSNPPCKPGDWVRFQRNGTVTVGVVAYVRPTRYSSSYWDIVTDSGSINEDDVLEVRSVP